MEQITPNMFRHAQIDSGTIACSCGNELFQQIELNIFRDTPKDLFSKIKSINPTDDIGILECFACGKRQLPPILYQTLNQKDLKLVKHLDQVLKKWNKKDEVITPQT